MKFAAKLGAECDSFLVYFVKIVAVIKRVLAYFKLDMSGRIVVIGAFFAPSARPAANIGRKRLNGSDLPVIKPSDKEVCAFVYRRTVPGVAVTVSTDLLKEGKPCRIVVRRLYIPFNIRVICSRRMDDQCRSWRLFPVENSFCSASDSIYQRSSSSSLSSPVLAEGLFFPDSSSELLFSEPLSDSGLP